MPLPQALQLCTRIWCHTRGKCSKARQRRLLAPLLLVPLLLGHLQSPSLRLRTIMLRHCSPVQLAIFLLVLSPPFASVSFLSFSFRPPCPVSCSIFSPAVPLPVRCSGRPSLRTICLPRSFCDCAHKRPQIIGVPTPFLLLASNNIIIARQ
jgi:hypothetical protein